jgi:hypothetical protein
MAMNADASAQLQRLAVELVLSLEEPLRSTVLLRYVEGRSAADIARAQRIPAATVRSRARDGLQRVRAELDRRHRAERWRFVFLPLQARPLRHPPFAALAEPIASILPHARYLSGSAQRYKLPYPPASSKW